MEVDITDQVRDHMGNQPYIIKCSTCGRALTFVSTLDGDLDMTLDVDPCETCLKEAEGERL